MINYSILFFACLTTFGNLLRAQEIPVVIDVRGQTPPTAIERAFSNPQFPDYMKQEQVSIAASSRGILEKAYDRVPGIVNGIRRLQFTPGFDWDIESARLEILTNTLREALISREQLLRKAEEMHVDDLVKNKRFLNQILKTEIESDRRLSAVLAELFNPSQQNRCFSSMGKQYEMGLLTSALYAENAKVSKSHQQERTNYAAAFFMAHVSVEPDLEEIRKLVGAIYRDLSIEQFLDLKVLMGQARQSESIDEYLKRQSNQKFDVASNVPALQAYIANKNKE